MIEADKCIKCKFDPKKCILCTFVLRSEADLYRGLPAKHISYQQRPSIKVSRVRVRNYE